MTVYIDQPIFQWRDRAWCHLWADTEEELHAFARRLGLKKAWFQQPPKASWKHYDIVSTKRPKALALGAIETDEYGPIYWMACRTANIAKMDQIERIREKYREPQP